MMDFLSGKGWCGDVHKWHSAFQVHRTKGSKSALLVSSKALELRSVVLSKPTIAFICVLLNIFNAVF